MTNYIKRRRHFFWLILCIVAPGLVIQIFASYGLEPVIAGKALGGIPLTSIAYLWWLVTVPIFATKIALDIFREDADYDLDVESLHKAQERRQLSLAGSLGWAHGLLDASLVKSEGPRCPYPEEEHPDLFEAYTKSYRTGFEHEEDHGG